MIDGSAKEDDSVNGNHIHREFGYPLKTVLKGAKWKTHRVFAPRFRFTR